MPAKIRNVLLFALLVGGAVASWWWGQPPPEDIVDAVPETVPTGYYLTDAVLLGTDDDGRILYRIHAERAEGQPERQRMRLTEVRVEYQPVAQVPWRISAALGEAPADRSYLELRGDVVLARHGGNGDGETSVRTSRMRLDPDAFVARSDAAVDVILNGQQLRAIGMSAYLQDDRLELESSVHGEFSP